MGYPILGDGSFDYDQPAPTPQRLTDPQAGYGEPSEAAMETAKDTIVTIQESYGIEYKGGEPLSEDDWRFWASTLDRFAAQAVAAREAEIVAALEELKVYHQQRYERFDKNALVHTSVWATESHAKATMAEEAINIIRKM